MIDKFLKKNIEKILITFLYMQPILDLSTGLTQNILKTTITPSSIIRLIFLILCMYYIIKIDNTKNKKKNKISTILIIIYLILFSITTIKYKDINALSFELKNTINTFYLPIITLALIDIFKQYKIKINIKTLANIYLIYTILVTIPGLTKTGFQSYHEAKLGTTGWFVSANAIGNIISILMPLIILYIIKIKDNKIKKTILILTTLYTVTCIGTKVPILSLIICTISTLLYYMIKWIKEKQNKKILISIITTIILTISSLITIPKTTFYKNIQIHKEYLGFNNYIEVLKDYKLIDHFIFSQRLTFLNNTTKTYQESNITQKLIGIGYIENYAKDNVSTKTIEIDYFDILYRNGIIGFILYFYIIIPIIIKKTKELKQNTLTNIEIKLSILLTLIIAFFAGHILITPNVCIFPALILIKGGLYEKTN